MEVIQDMFCIVKPSLSASRVNCELGIVVPETRKMTGREGGTTEALPYS